MKAIVIGGAGFIGSNLVDELLNLNYDVTVIDNLSTGKLENVNKKAKFVNIDISDDNQLDNLISAMDGGTYVFHLAALARVQPSIKNPVLFNKNNVNGTLNVLLAAHRAGVKRVVYSASSSAYGNRVDMPLTEDMSTNPLSPYGLQKLIGEQYAKMFSLVYGLETVSLRYFNVYGERQSLDGQYCLVMGIFARKRLNGEKLPITNDGNQKRDFTYVKDVVNANILAATSDKVGKGESINIGNGNNTSINELAKMFGGDVEYIGTVLEPNETLAGITKAKELLGWEPKGNLKLWVENYKKELGI